MADFDAKKYLDEQIDSKINSKISEIHKPTSEDQEAVKFSADDLAKHQGSCSCPDCPYCKGMRDRIDDIKLEDQIKDTISKVQTVIDKRINSEGLTKRDKKVLGTCRKLNSLGLL